MVGSSVRSSLELARTLSMMRRLGLVCSATDRRLGRSERRWWGSRVGFSAGRKKPRELQRGRSLRLCRKGSCDFGRRLRRDGRVRRLCRAAPRRFGIRNRYGFPMNAALIPNPRRDYRSRNVQPLLRVCMMRPICIHHTRYRFALLISPQSKCSRRASNDADIGSRRLPTKAP